MLPEIAHHIADAIRSVIGPGRHRLHEPWLDLGDGKSVSDVVTSTFVSSVGPALSEFESGICSLTGAAFAVALNNGTCALQLALMGRNIGPGDEVLVPALTFVATGNAVLHCGAIPHFVESENNCFGIDIDALEVYLARLVIKQGGISINSQTGRPIRAIIPVHVFGNIGEMGRLIELAECYGIDVIEDAAEALGSRRDNVHAGLFGVCGVISFNGNKIITTGGGGAIITHDEVLASRVRHLASAAKKPHRYEYDHDGIGFNFRMPALNAALGCSQLKKIDLMLEKKAALASRYKNAFKMIQGCSFYTAPPQSHSNHWLNAILLDEKYSGNRDSILEWLNDNSLGCRPLWKPLSDLPQFAGCPSMQLPVARNLIARVINIPSSAFLLEVQGG
jgi:perosamine synthetase